MRRIRVLFGGALGLWGMCVALSLALPTGCARDATQVRWDTSFEAAIAAERAGDLLTAERAYLRLTGTAPRAIDVGEAQKARGKLLLELGRDLEAIQVYLDMGQHSLRRADRARGHYEIARYAERVGRLDDAIARYRRLVLTYPGEMPGPRSLAHLRRLADTLGLEATLDHLLWTNQHWPAFRGTRLADNMLDYPARLAHNAFRRTGRPEFARHAEVLYRRLVKDHPYQQLVNDAYWELSLLYHRQGRYTEEISMIGAVQGMREAISLFGHDDHEYFWQGQFRRARLQMTVLNAPRDAAGSYQWFIDRFPDSIWIDDAHFWQGCAWLRADDPERAEASFVALREAYDKSKYLRRLDAARADPWSEVCLPKDFVEGKY